MQLVVNNLPPREGEALRLIAQGLTAKEAAPVMGCSYRNVEALMLSCMTRLQARNRVHLVAQAFAAGVIQIKNTTPALILCVLTFAFAPTIDTQTDDQMRVPTRIVRLRGARRDDLLAIELPA